MSNIVSPRQGWGCFRLLAAALAIGAAVNAFGEEARSWKSSCEEAARVALPAVEEPVPGNAESWKGCDSETLYYGIGRAKDYERARHCAYAELKAGDGGVFAGSAILMMIYANGKGLAPNLPLARKFACLLDGAPAEMSGRLRHMERHKPGTDPDLDLCDDITSGFMMGHCSRHLSRVEAVTREKHLDDLRAGWSEPQKAAFQRLKAAADRFAQERSRNEVDLSGTARGMQMDREEAIQKRDFLESLEKLEKGKAPQYTARQFQEEERKLGELYQTLQKKSGFWGTVTAEGVNDAQRAWVSYREAWLEFAKVRYPQQSKESIAAWFTKKRNHMLRVFVRGL